MSESSDFSDEISEQQDEKDEDFNIDDYRAEVDSDDSCEVPGTAEDDKAPGGDHQTMVEEQENMYIGPVLSGGHRFDRKFICIKYPGNVVNPDKAIETMGGMGNISTAVNTPNRRIELRFRPDDAYCKPACGDRHSNTGFLLRVRVKKSRVRKAQEEEARRSGRSSDNEGNLNSNGVHKAHLSESEKMERSNDIKKTESQEERVMTDLVNQVESCSVNTVESDSAKPSCVNLSSEDLKDSQDSSANNDKDAPNNGKNVAPTFDPTKYEDLSHDADYELPKLKVLGQVDTEFRFQNLCDFQYLPMSQCKTNPDALECIYEKIYPISIHKFSWLKNDVPYFLPPAAFSRMDTMQQYVPKTEVDSLPENIIGKNKKRKVGFTNFIYFSTPEVPTKPPAGIETAMKVKFVLNTHFQQMRDIFDERPIWSKNAIVYKTRFSNDRLKILLPSVAYYFVNGPWKIMWVKLGYDPRKDSSAMIYQTLDYRLKSMHGLGSTVKCKRNYSEYTLPYKSAPTSKEKTTILSAALSQGQSQKKEQDLNENVYIYREGMVPPSRQMFYQYCDVLVEEIQEMMAKLPDPLPGTKCHEKRGWLPSGFDVQCREIINKQVRAVLRKQMNIPEDHPISMPRKRKLAYKFKQSSLKTKRQKKAESLAAGAEESEKKRFDPKPGTSTQDD